MSLRSAAFLAFFALVGCRPLDVQPGPAANEPHSTIAVLDFSADDPVIGSATADACSTTAHQNGMRPIDRRWLVSTLQQQGLSKTGDENAEYFKHVGQMAKVDAVIVGTVKSSTVNARLISSRSGNVIRTANYRNASGGVKLEPHELGERLCEGLAKGLGDGM